MAPKIRGDPDDPTRMILGQIRKVFDPCWIQALPSGEVTIDFREEPDAEEELINFADMYGLSLSEKENSTWIHYYFE